MGNDQSRSSGGAHAEQLKPLDYYELLQVDEEATFDEIKVSARLAPPQRVAYLYDALD